MSKIFGIHKSTSHSVIASGGNGRGSTDTHIRRYTSATTVGSHIIHASSAANGDTFTIAPGGKGLYYIGRHDREAAAGDVPFGISLNSNQLTTAISLITAADVLSVGCASGTTAENGHCSAVVELDVGDVIRAHDQSNSVPSATAAQEVQFRIVKIESRV